MAETLSGQDDEDALEARLFAIECSISRLERVWQTVDASELTSLTRQVEQNCNDVIALSAAWDRSHQDEALQSMFVARVTSGINATIAESANVKRALDLLRDSLPSRLDPAESSNRIQTLQERIITQIEAGECVEEEVDRLEESWPVLGASLAQLKRISAMADRAVQQADQLMLRARTLAQQNGLEATRDNWAVNNCNAQLLLGLANAYAGKLELHDAAQLHQVVQAVRQEVKLVEAGRPPPEQIQALHKLAVETRAEGDRQHALAEQLLQAGEGCSDYDQPTLVQAVQAVQQLIADNARRAAGLEQHLDPIAAPPEGSTGLRLDECVQGRQQVDQLVDSMRSLRQGHEAALQELQDRMALAEANSAKKPFWKSSNSLGEKSSLTRSKNPLGRVKRAVNVITAAQRLALAGMK